MILDEHRDKSWTTVPRYTDLIMPSHDVAPQVVRWAPALDQRRSMRKVSIVSRSRMTGHVLVRLSRPDTGLLVACWLSAALMHSLQKPVVWGVCRTVYVP